MVSVATSANTEQKHQKQIKWSILSCLSMFTITCSTPRRVLTFTTTYERSVQARGSRISLFPAHRRRLWAGFQVHVCTAAPPQTPHNHAGCNQAHGADSAATASTLSRWKTNKEQTKKRRTKMILKALIFIKSSQYVLSDWSVLFRLRP